MAVYHFTLHAYRSWRPDHPRGYTIRDQGYQRPDPDKAREYDDRADYPPVLFDPEMQEVLIVGANDICTRRGWRLHAVGTETTHAHFIISWRGFIVWERVVEKLKNILSLLLGRLKRVKERIWFVKREGRKRVNDQKHLDHLLTSYLPSHNGLFWREGMLLPEIRKNIL